MIEQDKQAIYLAIAAIPKGKVAAYGQIAAIAGLPGKARQVGKLLSQLPKESTIPWFRVINAGGKISFPLNSDAYQLQKQQLLDDGVTFTGERINLKRYQWQPKLGLRYHHSKEPL